MTSDASNFTLNRVRHVIFYKKDELTTDLICCEVRVAVGAREDILFFHEEMAGWKRMIARLSELPGFDQEWFEKVVQPAFEEQRTVAFHRND